MKTFTNEKREQRLGGAKVGGSGVVVVLGVAVVLGWRRWGDVCFC